MVMARPDFLPSYEQITRFLGRCMKVAWSITVFVVVLIVVSNYMHEIASAPSDDDVDDVDVCEGMPRERENSNQGHKCTLLTENVVVKLAASKRTLLEVFCRKGKVPFIHQYFSTGILEVRCETDDFEVVSGSNASEVEKEFAKMWGIKLINYPAFLKSRHQLTPFNDTCKGLVHRQTCVVAFKSHAFDLQLIAIFLLGLILFLSADSLSKNTAIFYSSGVGMGVFMSLIIVMFVLSRFMYKKSGFVLAMLFGWSSLIYCLTQLYNNMATIFETYQTYIVAYITVTAFLSFALCYRWGPPSSPRTLDIIRWALQAFGLFCMFQSSHLPPWHRLSVALLPLCVYFIPFRSLFDFKGFRYNPIIRRLFRPKHRFLSEEEFMRQGSEATKKALDELRTYCRSPDCNAWKTISRVRTPQRLAAFVEGDSHLSDAEMMDYDHDPQPQLTDDENLSDDDLHFELH